MKKLLTQTLLTIAATTLAISSFSAQANVCKDDPRMFTIKTVLEKMENGENVEPLKLTPQTFLELTDNVRDKLGDNLRVYNEDCVPVQVFEGKTPKPIAVPYPTLEDGLHRSAMRGDTKTMNIIIQQFRPQSESPDRLVYMAKPLIWTPEAVESLYQVGLIEKVGLGYEYDSKNELFCNRILSPVTQIDLFAALGGKSTQSVPVIHSDRGNGSRFYLLNGKGTGTYERRYKINTESEGCPPFNDKRAVNSMTDTGLDVTSYSSKDMEDNIADYKAKQAANKL